MVTPVESAGLGRAAVRGGATAMGARLVGLAVQLSSVVVLARFLEPHDYGLVAMVVAIIGIGESFRDFGLSAAAIQAPTLSPQQRDNLWWLNSAAGLALTLTAAALAPVLALVYQEPETLLITVALAPTFLISGLGTQYRADLVRRLRFSRVAVIDLAAAVIALGGGIILAVSGAGYWALVGQQVGSGVLVLAGLGLAARWVPKPYDRDVPMRSFLRFGSSVLGSQTITYLSRNVDAVVVGRLFGPGDLGLYSRSLQLVRIPLNSLQAPVAAVALSVLSKVQGDDERFIEFVRRGQIVLAYPLVLGAAGMSAAAPDIVSIALGPTWSETAPLLRLVAIGEGLNILSSAGSWIYLSRGHGRSLMRYTLFSFALRMLFLAVGATGFGVIGVAWAYAVAPILLWPISLLWAGRVSGLRTVTLLRSSLRVVMVATTAGIATGVTVHLLAERPAALALGSAAVVHLAAAAALAVVPGVRRDYQLIWESLRLARR